MTTLNQTRLTDEDREAIELLLESHYSEHVTAWEMHFLESISEQQSLSAKQRNIFEDLCSRVLK